MSAEPSIDLPELEYVEASREELAALRARIIDQGYGAAVADGLIGWLVGGAEARSMTTRAKWRKILRELAETGNPGSPAKRRRARAGERGAAGLTLVKSAALAGSVAFAALYGPESVSIGRAVLTLGVPIILVMSSSVGIRLHVVGPRSSPSPNLVAQWCQRARSCGYRATA